MRGRRRQRRVRLLDSERANAAFTKRDGASSGPEQANDAARYEAWPTRLETPPFPRPWRYLV